MTASLGPGPVLALIEKKNEVEDILMLKSLEGFTILNTRPLAKALPLAEAIEKEGGKCIVVPSMSIKPISLPTNEMQQLFCFTEKDVWLFMSQYAVEYFHDHILSLHSIPLIGAVGKATAKALEKIQIPVTFIPKDASSEGLLSLPVFQSNLQGRKVTIFRGKNGRTLLDEALRARGADVREVILYERTLPVWTKEEYKLINNTPVDIALGMSADSLTYFFSCLELKERMRFFNVPWLTVSHRVANQAKKIGIKTVYVVSNGDVLASLIRLLK